MGLIELARIEFVSCAASLDLKLLITFNSFLRIFIIPLQTSPVFASLWISPCEHYLEHYLYCNWYRLCLFRDGDRDRGRARKRDRGADGDQNGGRPFFFG